MFQRVIVPLDGSAVAERALDYGAAIAEKFGVRLTLVRAYQGEEQATRTLAMMPSGDPGGGIVDPRTVDMLEEAAQESETDTRAYLDDMVKRLSARGLTVDSVMADSPPAELILQEADREPGTLVVMCTHGRGGLERLVFGSTAQDVLHRYHGPLLLIRVYEASDTGSGGDHSMDISIGADVVGTSGKLGEVHRVVVDARTDTITDLVVRHGGLFHGRERIVPLSHVTKVEGGVIHVDLDERGFAALEGYTEDRFRSPEASYLGPPGFRRDDFLLDVTVAEGAQGGGPTPPMGFPGGDQVSPDDMVRPAVSPGTDVLDEVGEKIGEVHEISFAPDTGKPTRLVVRSGHIFHHDTEVPADWIKEISDDGILLNVPKSKVESLNARA